MKNNFETCIPLLFAHEGGYVDNPKDPGGATNLGITFNTLQAYRGRKITKTDVKNLTKAEATRIYKQEYWDRIWGDKLPLGLDYAIFDFTVNSGVKRAVETLQRLLGMTGKDVDGQMGSETFDALNRDKRTTPQLLTEYCNQRLSWLRTLSTFKTFGKGWTSRVNRVALDGRKMAARIEVETPLETTEKPAKADQVDTKVTEALKSPEAWGPLSGLLAAVGSFASGTGPMQWVLAAGMAVGIGVGLYFLIKRVRNS